MKNYNNKTITKEIVEELEKLEFVQKPNFENYDLITVSNDGEFLELYKEEEYKQVASDDGENIEYKLIHGEESRRFRNNNFDGVYVEY